jgi:hypothetical protein
VEYFFRWMKCLMGCGHWLAESPRGITLQIYLALIGALLLQLDLERRPIRRVWELLQWHQMSMMDIFGFQPADPAGWEASVPSEPRRTN